MNVERVATV